MTIALLVCLVTAASGQTSYQDVLYKGDYFQAHLNRMVIMDDATFGMYNYYRSQYDSLSELVRLYDCEIQALDSLNSAKQEELAALIQVKDQTIIATQEAYSKMKSTLELSIAETQQCRQNYFMLEGELERQKKVKRKLLSSTLVLAVITVISIAL